jgi:antitoxin ParD1/3/4
MATLEINLPEPLKEFVDAQVQGGEYKSASDFVRHLLQEAQQHVQRRDAASYRLEQMLLQGLDSGSGVVLTEDNWDQFWAERNAALQTRLAERRRGNQ